MVGSWSVVVAILGSGDWRSASAQAVAAAAPAPAAVLPSTQISYAFDPTPVYLPAPPANPTPKPFTLVTVPSLVFLTSYDATPGVVKPGVVTLTSITIDAKSKGLVLKPQPGVRPFDSILVSFKITFGTGTKTYQYPKAIPIQGNQYEVKADDPDLKSMFNRMAKDLAQALAPGFDPSKPFTFDKNVEIGIQPVINILPAAGAVKTNTYNLADEVKFTRKITFIRILGTDDKTPLPPSGKAQADVAKAQADIITALAAIKTAQGAQKDARDDLTTARAEIPKAVADLKKAWDDLKKPEGTEQKAEADEKKAEADVKAAQDEITKAKDPGEVAKAQDDLKKAQTALKTTGDALKKARADVKTAQDEITKAQANEIKAQTDTKAALAEITKAQADEKKARADLKKAQADLTKAQADLKTALAAGN